MMSSQQLADRYGVGVNAVTYHLRRANVRRERKPSHAGAVGGPPAYWETDAAIAALDAARCGAALVGRPPKSRPWSPPAGIEVRPLDGGKWLAFPTDRMTVNQVGRSRAEAVRRLNAYLRRSGQVACPVSTI